MKTIPLTPDTEALARRLVWFEEPAEALSDTVRFVAYALARATHEDMKVLRAFLTKGLAGKQSNQRGDAPTLPRHGARRRTIHDLQCRPWQSRGWRAFARHDAETTLPPG